MAKPASHFANSLKNYADQLEKAIDDALENLGLTPYGTLTYHLAIDAPEHSDKVVEMVLARFRAVGWNTHFKKKYSGDKRKPACKYIVLSLKDEDTDR